MTFIGGYLGAGKTTVINEMLARTETPIAVMVNDVGEINVDAALIRRRSGDTVELSDGCVCCSLSGGFGVAMQQLVARETPPEHVIVELSGLAEPSRVVPWAATPGFRLDGVIVLVDAVDGLGPLRDDRIGPLVQAQLAGADLLLLSKTDLATPQQIAGVRTELARLVPGVDVVESSGPALAAAILEGGGRRPGGVTDVPAPTLFDAHDVTTVTLPADLDRAALDAVLDALGPDVVRAKGIIDTTDQGRVLVQVVGRRRTIEPLSEAEATPATDLVVIRVK